MVLVEDLSLREEISAWARVLNKPGAPWATREQVKYVIILMKEECGDDRELRIAILRVLMQNIIERTTGIDLWSTNDLTLPAANLLIDQLAGKDGRLSPHGRKLLRSAALEVEAGLVEA